MPDNISDFEGVCIDCGRNFTIVRSQVRWFESRGIPLPKRCKPCRDHRRAIDEAERGQLYD
jgi:hypothetical protein